MEVATTAPPTMTTTPPCVAECQKSIEKFWPDVNREIRLITYVEPGKQLVPMSRIRKIMRESAEVKMIASDVPMLFVKAIEIFVHELTLRAFLHTADSKRRTLQRSDIAVAISKYDQFDFLIDIVPRLKFEGETIGERAAAGGRGERDVHCFIELPPAQHQALQTTTTTTATNGGATLLELRAPKPISANQSQQQQQQQQQNSQEPQLAVSGSDAHVAIAQATLPQPQPVQGTVQATSGQNISFWTAGANASTVSTSSPAS